MRLLVTFAMGAEFSPWRARHAFVPYEFQEWERRRPFDVLRANVEGHEVTVLLTGMGPENSKSAISPLLAEAPDVCISTGLAGALRADLRAGNVVVARRVRTPDREINVNSDEFLETLAIRSGAKPVATFLTVGEIIGSAERKLELACEGDAVEMESSYVMNGAQMAGIPTIAVRAISDTAEEDMPVDFSRITDSRGHLKFQGLFTEVLLQPYRIPLLWQFGRQSRAAAVSLADFLDRYVSAVVHNWSRKSVTMPHGVVLQ